MRGPMLAVLLVAAPASAAAKPFTVGTGQNGGIAIDDAGTVYSGYRVLYATSTDGGVLWSSVLTTAHYGSDLPSGLEAATNASGAGAVVTHKPFGGDTVEVSRFTPRTAPVARRRVRGARVLRRRTARIPVRVISRRGMARTLRLRVRRCRATR